MPELYNTSTRQIDQIDDEELLREAILSGSHSFPAKSKVYVTNPYGEKKYIPAEDAEAALTQGYTIHGKNVEIADEFVRDNDNLKGAAKVFLGQAADEALLGIPELVYDKTKTPLEVAKKEALKNHFSAANAAGGILGFLGGAALGSPAFKAASAAGEATTKAVAKGLAARAAGEVPESAIKQMAKTVTAKGAGFGVEGALLSAPYAFTEAVLGDPDDAAETLMYGVGVGSLFGAGAGMGSSLKKLAAESSLIREAREKISEGIRSRRDLKSIAEDKAVEALNPNLGQRERLKALEEVFDESGEVASIRPTENLKVIGRDLLDNDIVTAFGSKEDMYERLVSKTTQLRDEVNSSLRSFDDRFKEAATISTDDLINNIRARVADNPYFKTVAYKPFVARIESQLENLALASPRLSFEAANREKVAFQQIAKSAYNSVNSGIDVNTAQVIAEIPREINKMLRATAKELDPEELANLLEKQRLLGNLSQAENIAKKSAARESRNNDFGLTSIITGGAGVTTGAILGGAPGAIAFGLVGLMGRELSRRYGDQVVATSLNKYGGMLFAEQAMKRAATRLDALPQILKKLSTEKSLPKRSTLGLDAVNRMFRDTGKKEGEPQASVQQEKVKKIEQIRNDLSTWASNSDLTGSQIAQITNPISETGAPKIASSLAAKMGGAVSYLYNAVPKPVAPDSMFSPKITYQPPDYEINSFLQKVAVVEDPFVVFSELEGGRLTLSHMDALKNVYPGMHRYMVEKVKETAQNESFSLPYQTRLQLSILMGEPIDPSLSPERMSAYQKNYAGEEEGQGQGLGDKISLSGDLSKSLMTPAQELA